MFRSREKQLYQTAKELKQSEYKNETIEYIMSLLREGSLYRKA